METIYKVIEAGSIAFRHNVESFVKELLENPEPDLRKIENVVPNVVKYPKLFRSLLKTDIQAVENWQFVNSLRLWSDFVATYSIKNNRIRSLIHPLVQLIVGTARLSGGERWIPLRFHCVAMLHALAGCPQPSGSSSSQPDSLVGSSLSSDHRLLVPSISLLLGVFRLVNFNRRCRTASIGQLDLRLLLHFSPSQKSQTGSLDSLVVTLIDLLTEACAIQANSTAFPELALPVIGELKHFASACKVGSFTRQAKALLVKLVEHSNQVTGMRTDRRLKGIASNSDQLRQLENQLSLGACSQPLAPFWDFYLRHKLVRATDLARLAESNMKQTSRPHASTIRDRSRPSSKDASDDDDDSDDSNESFEYDDGVTVTHVSATSGSKSNDLEKDDDDDFDLEAALREEEEVTQDVVDLHNDDDDDDQFDDRLEAFQLSDDDEDVEQHEEDYQYQADMKKKRKRVKIHQSPLAKRSRLSDDREKSSTTGSGSSHPPNPKIKGKKKKGLVKGT